MTQSALAAIQQAQILKQEEDKLAQAQAAKQAAVAYVSSEDPQLGSLVQSGALPPSEGIQAVRSQKAIKPISPDVYTQLVANHGHENASKYVQTRNLADLGPRLDPKVTEALSTWGQRLKDQGYIPGTPQFEEQMRIVNQKNIDAIGKSVTVNQMNSMEKKEFLAESITTDPRYDAVLEMESKLSKASSVMPNARRGERPAITLLQRTISDLYNSDTRAASEIDRLVNANKSITETVTDAGTQFIFGELTPNALTELQNILNNANMLINDTKTSIVNNKLSLYESEISDEAIRNTILKSYGGTVQVDPIDIRQYLPR
jgi:hypothetical protein